MNLRAHVSFALAGTSGPTPVQTDFPAGLALGGPITFDFDFLVALDNRTRDVVHPSPQEHNGIPSMCMVSQKEISDTHALNQLGC